MQLYLSAASAADESRAPNEGLARVRMVKMRVQRLSFLALLAAPTFALAAVYRFSVDGDSQLATVTVSVGKPSAAFNMPAWAPGDYELFHYGQYVKSIAFKKGGKTVVGKADGVDRWTVEGGADEVTYSVAPSRGNFTPNLRIKADEYYASGPGVLGWFDDHADETQTIQLATPAGWKAAMALPNGEPAANQSVFKASSYDVLIDSPFVVGATVRTHEFTVEGKPHAIVGYNMSANADLKGFADVASKIAGEAHRIFGEFGYDRYLFFLDFGGPGGGLEHLNCTRIGLSSRATPLGSMGILAHEYFHNFNVKRIRAKALGPFDYSKPAVTGTLWWLEGVTDYYADVLLTRAGLTSIADFQRGEASGIQGASGGKYLEISADEASRRVWEVRGSFGFGGVNYYSRGHSAGAVLDLAIRARSEGKRSLDDVIRKLWSECKGGKPGYVDVRLRELCIEFGGEDLGEIYDLCVMKPGPLPIDLALAPWGGKLGPDGFSVSNGQALAAWPSKIH